MTAVATARDIMLADATNACGGLAMTYEDAPPASALTGTTQWARATVQHAGGGQKGFGDGIQKHLRIGTLCVEIFTPVGDGLTGQDTKCEQVLNYLEGRKSYPIWYRNIRAAEAPRDGGYTKTNVYADFEYESNH